MGDKAWRVGDAQVSSCRTQLTSKTRPRYCRRYRVCETHLRALTMNINGAAQRWCQKCSRFHEVDAFTDKQHSCTQSLLRSRTQHMQRTAKRTNVTAITSPPPAAPLTPFPTVPYESVAQQLAVFGWDVPLVPGPDVALRSLFAFLNDIA